MDATECYVLRDMKCTDCGGTGRVDNHRDRRFSLESHCARSGAIGYNAESVPLIDALRALGIDVPEPEEAPPAMCPP